MTFAVKFARLLTVALPIALPLALAHSAHAQAAPAPAPTSTGPLKIAVANPSRIFNEMQERNALNGKMQEEQKRFMATQKEKAGEIETLRTARDNLLAGSPQHEAQNRALMEASMRYKVWVETERLIAEQTQKRQMKQLFEKIQVTIAEVAKEGGYDLVLAESNDTLPSDAELEQMNISQFKVMLLQKDVLFNNGRADISQVVLARLDAKFKAAGAAAPPQAERAARRR